MELGLPAVCTSACEQNPQDSPPSPGVLGCDSTQIPSAARPRDGASSATLAFGSIPCWGMGCPLGMNPVGIAFWEPTALLRPGANRSSSASGGGREGVAVSSSTRCCLLQGPLSDSHGQKLSGAGERFREQDNTFLEDSFWISPAAPWSKQCLGCSIGSPLAPPAKGSIFPEPEAKEKASGRVYKMFCCSRRKGRAGIPPQAPPAPAGGGSLEKGARSRAGYRPQAQGTGLGTGLALLGLGVGDTSGCWGLCPKRKGGERTPSNFRLRLGLSPKQEGNLSGSVRTSFVDISFSVSI